MNSQVPFKNRFHIFFSVEPELKRKIVDLQLEHRGSPQAPFFKVFLDPKKFFWPKKSIIIFAKRCAKYWKMKQAKKRGELGVYQGLFIRLIKSSLFLAPKRALKFTLNFTEGERVRAWISYKRASWRYILQAGGWISNPFVIENSMGTLYKLTQDSLLTGQPTPGRARREP